MAETTKRFGLTKPAQDDFYNIDVQNENMDIIDEKLAESEDNHVIKTYTSLQQIGLTPGTETITDIVNSLPNGSMLMVGTDGNHNVSIYPSESFGTLFVIKRSSARTLFLYSTATTNELYYGNYYSVSNIWSGWITFLHIDGGTLYGALNIQTAQPALELKGTSNNSGTKIHKNASTAVDNGTYISDISSDGTNDILILRRTGATNADKLYLRIQSADGSTYETYRIYGEHNKPTPADIGAATKAEVQTAQSTADTAKTNASKAQATADSAVTAAANAQSTADSAVTKTNNAQSTADIALEKANASAITKTYQVAISISSWSEDSVNGGFACVVSVDGILSTDNPIADVVLGSDIDANALYIEAWALVTRIATSENTITLYANESKPETAFTIQLKVVR